MTAVSFRAPGVFVRSYGTVKSRVSGVARAVVAPHRASLMRLLDMPLTVIGIGLIDFGAFHYVHMIGWVVTGVSLLLVEHMISDDEGSP